MEENKEEVVVVVVVVVVVEEEEEEQHEAAMPPLTNPPGPLEVSSVSAPNPSCHPTSRGRFGMGVDPNPLCWTSFVALASLADLLVILWMISMGLWCD